MNSDADVEEGYKSENVSRNLVRKQHKLRPRIKIKQPSSNFILSDENSTSETINDESENGPHDKPGSPPRSPKKNLPLRLRPTRKAKYQRRRNLVPNADYQDNSQTDVDDDNSSQSSLVSLRRHQSNLSGNENKLPQLKGNLHKETKSSKKSKPLFMRLQEEYEDKVLQSEREKYAQMQKKIEQDKAARPTKAMMKVFEAQYNEHKHSKEERMKADAEARKQDWKVMEEALRNRRNKPKRIRIGIPAPAHLPPLVHDLPSSPPSPVSPVAIDRSSELDLKKPAAAVSSSKGPSHRKVLSGSSSAQEELDAFDESENFDSAAVLVDRHDQPDDIILVSYSNDTLPTRTFEPKSSQQPSAILATFDIAVSPVKTANKSRVGPGPTPLVGNLTGVQAIQTSPVDSDEELSPKSRAVARSAIESALRELDRDDDDFQGSLCSLAHSDIERKQDPNPHVALSDWVAAMRDEPDSDEEKLIEVYATGFSLLMSET